MIKVQNPVLTGFHPDPSICRGRDKYYIANSTFEYFPGLTISESSDLINWETVARPLDNKKLLDMDGNPKSSGVWAPCISYDNGMYYIVYSNMKTWATMPFKDSQNYIITSETIEGPWSEPVYMGSSGFDASLFHDTDGRKYYVNMEWDHRKGGGDESFSGILVQEVDPITFALIGKATTIFHGTSRGLVEGPHIYKIGEYYYLLSAEGGTSYQHAESVARSKNILGPYEVHPQELLISALDTDAYIQKAGHGALLETFEGDWYFAHLCGRPLKGKDGRCPLGRETAIQNIVWRDNWPYLPDGGIVPRDFYTVPEGTIQEKDPVTVYDIQSKKFHLDFQSIRVPLSEDMVEKKEDTLILTGKQSLYSVSKQSVLVRRQQEFKFQFSFQLSHEPTSFQHMAGLLYRYNEDNQFYLYSSYDETLNTKILNVLTIDNANPTYFSEVGIPYEGNVYLKVEGDYAEAYFSYSTDGENYARIGDALDVSILSDEYAYPMGFTGAYVGMAAQDLKFYEKKASFREITYVAQDTEGR